VNCEHCRQLIPDGEPIYRAHSGYRSYGRGISGSVCLTCSEIEPRPWHLPALCCQCGRLVINDAARKPPRFILCGASACRQAAYGQT
jgi:hypothetical protein